MSNSQEVTMSNIIHVSVSHMIYPVTEVVLRQVFELYGCGVTRMAVFEGNGWVEASVQLRSGHEAVYARDALHGRNIYDGCCNMAIKCTCLRHTSGIIPVHGAKQTHLPMHGTFPSWDCISRSP